jgi:signal transduction histidine kinase/ActR/RegA family two-component response regulator
MKPPKFLYIGTSGLSDPGEIDRVFLVNTMCSITAFSILVIGGMLSYNFQWRPSLLFPFIGEFILNASVFYFNARKWHKAAAAMLYFLQCIMIVYISAIVGSVLRLDIVIVLLFAVTFLIFKDKRWRRAAAIGALLDFFAIEALYYKNPFQASMHLQPGAAYLTQLLVVLVISIIIVVVSAPYVRSNDTNEDLKRANHLIKIFVAQITHELRTPLDTIHHVTQLLRSETKKDPSLKKIQPLVDIGWTVSSTARNIVNNVLDMAQIEAGKMTATVYEAFRVRPFFENIIEVHRVIAQNVKMRLELKIDPEVPAVIFGDPLNINQILTNLLANAFKYGFSEHPVLVEVSRQMYTWEIKVSNYSEGIPQDRQDAIFDPFVTTGNGHIQGSGLGLFIVRTKVSMMGGSIRVESQKLGKTTFSVLLPLQEGKFKDIPDGPGVDLETADLAKVNVLVAEDDKLISYLFARFLEEMGCAYTLVSNGRELLEVAQRKCREECPDIIILDCHMPELDGLETIGLLKQDPALKNIPIIVTTGDIYSPTLDNMLAAGANTYLKKPIDHNALRKTIQLYLRKLPQN